MDAPSNHTIIATDGEWVETAVPGVRMKILAIDRARDRVTMLLKGEPGPGIPPIGTPGPRRCYVISGSVIVEGRVCGRATSTTRRPTAITARRGPQKAWSCCSSPRRATTPASRWQAVGTTTRGCESLGVDIRQHESIVSANDTMTRTPDLLPVPVDLLILRTLQKDALHGWAIAERIQEISEDVLQINQGSLYPALHRLEHHGWLDAEWKVSELGRRARVLPAHDVGPSPAHG